MATDFLLSLVIGAMCHQYMLWVAVVFDISLALTFFVLIFILIVCGFAVGLHFHDVHSGYIIQMELNRIHEIDHSTRIFADQRHDYTRCLAAKAA